MTLTGSFLVARLLWKITSPADAFAAMALSVGGVCALWMLSAQLLSPFHAITALHFGYAVFVIGVLLALSCNRIKPLKLDADYTFSAYIREGFSDKTRMFIILGIVAVTLALGIAAYLAHPWGDNYHFSKPAYWVQTQSLLPFHAHNFRIVCFAPGGDIHHLPFYLYFAYQKSNVLLGTLCILILPGAVWSLSKRCGATSSHAWVLSALAFSLSPVLGSSFSGGVHIMLPSLLVLASFIYLMAGTRTGSPSPLAFVGLSMFCFSLAAGMKNPVILAVPGYLFAMIALMGIRFFLRPRELGTTVAAGLLGIFLSGAAWNYASNYSLYGNPKGSEIAISESVAQVSPQEVYTRSLRGLSYLAGVTIAPGPMKEMNSKIAAMVNAMPGVKKHLEGEEEGKHPFWRYPDTGPPAHAGLGPLGPFFLVAVILNGWLILRKWKACPDSNSQAGNILTIAVLLFYLIIGFVLLHGMVRWSLLGRFRLSHAIILPAVPLMGILLSKAWSRHGLLALAAANCLVVVAMCTAFSLRRHGDVWPFPLSKLYSMVAVRSAELTINSPKGTMETLKVLEDFNKDGEIYRYLSNKVILNPSTIAFISNFNSAESWLFGERLQHRILPIVRDDTEHTNKLLSSDFLIVDGFDDTGFKDDYGIAEAFDLKLTVLTDNKPFLFLYERKKNHSSITPTVDFLH